MTTKLQVELLFRNAAQELQVWAVTLKFGPKLRSYGIHLIPRGKGGTEKCMPMTTDTGQIRLWQI